MWLGIEDEKLGGWQYSAPARGRVKLVVKPNIEWVKYVPPIQCILPQQRITGNTESNCGLEEEGMCGDVAA